MIRAQIKNIIIAGAAGNLGRETVKQFLTDGKRVVSFVQNIKHRDELIDYLADLHKADKHTVLVGDLSIQSASLELVEKAYAFLGSIDAALSTAGAFHHANVEDLTEKDYETLFGSNFKSCFYLSRAVLPHMKKARAGHLIFISALSTQGRGEEGMSLYLASKAALNMFTLCLAREVRTYGITVNAIMPSVIDSLSNRKSMPKEDFSKWVQPEDLVAIMNSLLSDALHTVSGTLIAATGKL